MSLPKWYLQCAEDYLSILRSSQDYTQSELFEATRNQRLAEYKLMKEKMRVKTKEGLVEESSMAPVSNSSLVPTQSLVNLRLYDNSIMSKGHLQINRPKQNVGTSRFWENILT